MENKALTLLANSYFDIRAQIEQHEETVKALKAGLKDKEERLISLMESNEINSVKHERGTLYLREDVYARIADQDVLFKYLRDNDLGDVIKETIHVKTLSSMAKDMPDLPGIKIFNETRIGARRAQGGKREGHGESGEQG